MKRPDSCHTGHLTEVQLIAKGGASLKSFQLELGIRIANNLKESQSHKPNEVRLRD